MKRTTLEPKTIVSQKRESPKVRLLCFPYAGGGASAFRAWADILPQEVEVCAVQPPGRENRILEKPISDVHLLVQELLPGIRMCTDIPFALFGYSTGALVAFEVVRELRRQKLPLPVHLFVAAARAPHIPEPFPLHHLPEEEFIEGLRRFSGTSEAVLKNKEVMSLYSPILRADLAIEEAYCHHKETPLGIPISAFYGSYDEEGKEDVVMPWEQYTTKYFSLHEIEGDHFFIKSSIGPLLLDISKKLTQYF